MSTVTRGHIQDLVSKFAAENPTYRQALIADPKSVIEKQFNVSLRGMSLMAIVETADTTYVVVPHVPAEGELSDSDLERVAGGFPKLTGTLGQEQSRAASAARIGHDAQ